MVINNNNLIIIADSPNVYLQTNNKTFHIILSNFIFWCTILIICDDCLSPSFIYHQRHIWRDNGTVNYDKTILITSSDEL